MRQALKFFGICAVLTVVFGNDVKAESLSFFDVPFRNVDYVVGSRISWLYFRGVILNESVYDVAVPLDFVEVRAGPGDEPYTTLDVIDLPYIDSYIYGLYLKPRLVRIIVRREKDLMMWREFLLKIKEKQEAEREYLLRPRRVLPPVLP